MCFISKSKNISYTEFALRISHDCIDCEGDMVDIYTGTADTGYGAHLLPALPRLL